MENKFNYVIGHYWANKGSSIGSYSNFGEVQFGTQIEANELLNYVKEKSPNKPWLIFKVVETP